jgi:uracil-DNA glycosylase family 4
MPNRSSVTGSGVESRYRAARRRPQLTTLSVREDVRSVTERRAELERELVACSRCARLSEWRERAASNAPRAWRGQTYWSRPVPSFGPWSARLLVLGLAPGAHGANRTGRPFTGDGAGPFLYGALHRAGFASAPTSSSRDDGLRLIDARIANAARCAPPGNRPTPQELATCFPLLRRELELATRTRVILCLGAIAWSAALRALGELGPLPSRKPPFGHGAEFEPGDGRPALLASFHPSQLNTRTGRLTAPMFDAVLRRAKQRLDRPA